MNIKIRAGHNFQSPGASALIDETSEARKVTASLIKYLKALGNDVTDVTPGDMDSNSDLVYGVSIANNQGADLFISIHFNKAYNHYDGAIGSECWVYSKSDNITLDEQVATRIVNALGSLGFKNRGVKESTELYELKSTKMASVIVEVCFVEATEDVALYQRLRADKIGQVIAYAIANQSIIQNAPKKEEVDMQKIVIYHGDADLFSAVLVAQKNRCALMKKSDFEVSGIKVTDVIQIGGKSEDTDRYQTMKNAVKYL